MASISSKSAQKLPQLNSRGTKVIVTIRNRDIEKIGTQHERHTTLKVYADRRGPRTSDKLVEQNQSHIKEYTRKLKRR